jgi:hypothetical protein
MCFSAADYAIAYDYELTSYEATFYLIENNPDAYVTLRIVYSVGDETKGDGFKFVGDHEISELSVTDGKGNLLECGTKKLRETRVEWFFPPVRNSEQTVIVSFRIHRVLSGMPWSNSLDAPWVGVWRVPVKQATYRVVFPPGFQPETVSSKPADHKRVTADGKEEITVFQPVLATKNFELWFSPGMVTRPSTFTIIVGIALSIGLILIIFCLRRYSNMQIDQSTSSRAPQGPYLDRNVPGGS